jgi:hypothetical protein
LKRKETGAGKIFFWRSGGLHPLPLISTNWTACQDRAEFAVEYKTAVVLLSNYGDTLANDHSIDKIGIELLRLAAKGSSKANRALSLLRQLAD